MMGHRKKIVIAGASGLVGGAALARFGKRDDWDVVAISRRPPLMPLGNATHVSIDLGNPEDCARSAHALSNATHVVYAALSERSDDLFAGWTDPQQIALNEAMLINLMEPLIQGSPGLQHVSLIHGGKAYGVHLRDQKLKMPLHEGLPRHAGDNFYHRQEDYITQRQRGSSWSWTIFRPGGIWGAAIGANMNSLLVLAVFACLLKEAGRGMPVPSGYSAYNEPTDVDLVAEAVEWAGTAPTARNEIFNIANGDILAWHDLFELTADILNMPLESPRKFDMREEIENLSHLWPAMVDRYGLQAPRDLNELLGTSLQIAGMLSNDVPPEDVLRWGLLSTIKIRQAGFTGCVSSFDSLRKYIERYQDLRVIPTFSQSRPRKSVAGGANIPIVSSEIVRP